MTSTQRRGRHSVISEETFACGQAALQVLWDGVSGTPIVDSSGPWHAIEPGPADIVFSLCGREVARMDGAAVWPDPRRTPACVVCAELALD
ncbi:hypothetical protein [Klenkia brasiliensis]|uniref:Uncharacterized protein n=1 Tax=Klenkia brasiliensis TaxID=333142 RepID=A0A1G7UWG4_9ACTN|nr:hypothetical protein [Klenkia brasiliensis]SDG51804.1 hypothetical protein SAMN05660324_2802 [Klenkia brasiliensis]